MKNEVTQNDPSQVIRKSNELIEARYRLNIWEQRLIITLLANISPQDADFQRYCIRVSDFAKMWQLNTDKSLYKKVQDAADSLVGRTVQISEDPTISETVSWFAYVKYVRGSGEIEMEFHSSLKPYLLQLQKHFTQYQLGHVVNFKSQYSIRIYELLKMEVFKHPQGDFAKRFKYQALRELLEIAETEYRLFADFRRWVLTPAMKEISSNTDLEITDIQYGKTGRKITDITVFVTVRSAEELLSLHLDTFPTPKLHMVIEQLVSLGFSVETAKKYKNKYGVRRLKRNIAFTKAKQEEGLVKDIPAYLNKAITEDMGNGWEISQQQQAQREQQQQQQATKREAQADLRHLQKMAEMSGVPLDVLFPKPAKK